MNNFERMRKEQKLSLKDYVDIEWLMLQIDVRELFERCGFPITYDNGETIRSYCPDHFVFKGCKSSDPNWVLNTRNGKTTCHTEFRHSNLLYVLARARSNKTTPSFKELEETVQFILNGDKIEEALLFDKMKRLQELAKEDEEKEKQVEKKLDNFQKQMLENPVLTSGYKYFMYPPNKKPTNINKETVDFFKVYQMTYGFYADHVMIPVFSSEEMVGICAINILDKEKWLKLNSEKESTDYKKVRFNQGFKTGKYLYNFDLAKSSNHDFVVIVEGVRDVMKLYQEGFDNGVGLFGCDLKYGQQSLFYQLNKKIIILLDGDEAGREKSQKLYEELNPNFDTKIVYTPIGHDPKHLDNAWFKENLIY